MRRCAALEDTGRRAARARNCVTWPSWRDADRNGGSEPGEVRPLGEHGIEALSCRVAEGRWHLHGGMAERRPIQRRAEHDRAMTSFSGRPIESCRPLRSHVAVSTPASARAL